VMRVHMDLHDQSRLLPEHFAVWLEHFNNVLDSLFAGPTVEMAKTRALSIATVMQIKMS
jgi:hemoglobin